MKSLAKEKFTSLFFIAFLSLIDLFCLDISAIAQSVSISLTSENGISWQFRKAGDSIWLPATIPGTVHTDLLDNHLIPDPYYSDNEKKVQWVENEDWEYQAYFSCPAYLLSQKNIELQFDGLDTYADVYLNDTLILRGENMFRIYTVDVQRLLSRYSPPSISKDTVQQLLNGTTNHLLIHFYSATKKGTQIINQIPYPLAGDVDGKTVTRKAQYQYGWDWGPRLISCGIWKNINLIGWSPFNLEHALVNQDSLINDSAYLSIHALINSNVEKSYSFTFSNTSGTESATTIFDLQIGMNEVIIPLKISQPQLWWCNGWGEQKLYNLQLCIDGDLCAVLFRTKFGIRTLKLVQQKDSIGSGFTFELNGIPVFMKGANYIPPDNFIPRVTHSDYVKIIDDAVASNMNMLRVWGGGVYADDAFYQLCDEKGILIWQDFMFAGAMVPGDSAFVENVKQEIKDNVIRLRNHACIALWCGNNEIDEAWHNWGWQAQYHYEEAAQKKIWNDYLNLFQTVIPDVIHQYDPQRFYVPSSPEIGWGHKESLQQGDAHYWGVWWGKEPFDIYNQKIGRFMSEYGFQGLPAMKTINKFSSTEDYSLKFTGENKFSDVMNIHQKHPTGFETINEYLERDYNTPKDFESYVYVSQLLQRDGITTAIEAHRRAKPYCSGTLYWQLNDCWPVVSWSSRDYYGEWKALQFAVKELYKPFLISIIKEDKYFKVFVVSDSLAEVTGLLKLDLYDFNGTKIKSAEKIVTVSANQSQLVFSLDEKKLPKNFAAGKSVLAVSFATGEHLLAKKNYFFTKPKDLALPKLTIEQHIKYLDDHSLVKDFPYQYQIELSSNHFAKDVYLECQNEDLKFRENFFDLFPNQKKTINLFSKSKINVTDLSIKITSLVDSY
ncbi:MAG: glycoside hydrolase family 2 protein [Chitinophagaceae bacterium]|nr:glycoside hydrolase family 2 protein [Chitinophagaceae bacterium]